MGGVFIVLWFLFLFVFGVGGTIFWIVKLVEVLKIPDAQYRGAGTEKLTWGLVVGLLGWLGGLIWQFAKRSEVLAATPIPTYWAPPGWYPDPRTGQMTWFDGFRWVPGRVPPVPGAAPGPWGAWGPGGPSGSASVPGPPGGGAPPASSGG